MVIFSESFPTDTPRDTDRHESVLTSALGGLAVIVPSKNPVSSHLEIRSAVMLCAHVAEIAGS